MTQSQVVKSDGKALCLERDQGSLQPLRKLCITSCCKHSSELSRPVCCFTLSWQALRSSLTTIAVCIRLKSCSNSCNRSRKSSGHVNAMIWIDRRCSLSVDKSSSSTNESRDIGMSERIVCPAGVVRRNSLAVRWINSTLQQ